MLMRPFRWLCAWLLLQAGSAVADVSFVDVQSNAVISASNSLTLAVPSAAQYPDFLVAIVVTKNGVTVTGPSGWTLLDEDTRDNVKRGIWYQFVPLGGIATNQTWNFGSNTQSAGGIIALRDVNENTPLTVRSENNGNANTATASAATTPSNGSMVLAVFSGENGDIPFGAPSAGTTGWARNTGNNISGVASTLSYRQQALAGSTGTTTASYAISGSTNRDWFADTLIINRSLPVTAGFWRFEESSWNGTTAEVKSDLTNLHGTAFGGANTANSNPAIAGNPGTCRYASFDGVNDYVSLPDDSRLDLTTEFTVMAWINPANLYTSGHNGSLRSIFSRDTNYEFHVNGDRQVYWWFKTAAGNTRFINSETTISTNVWQHVAIRYRSGSQQIFINGVASAVYCSGSTTTTASCNTTGSPLTNDEDVQIGWDFLNGRQWSGLIDEVRIYNSALSDAEIVQLKDQTFPCSAIDHYQIEHDGNGLTCQPETVTLKACTNASCSSMYGNIVTVNLSPTNTWVGGFSKTFNTGTITTQFWPKTAGNYTLGISNATQAAQNPLQCRNTSTGSSSCVISFADSGLLYNVPDVTANKTSGSFALQAVRTDNTTQKCVPYFSSAPRKIKFWANYSNPTTGTLPVSINGSSIATANSGTTPAPTELTLNFDSAASTNLSLLYPDAGQVVLNARFDGTTGTDEEGLTLLGSGDTTFLSLPAGYCIRPMQLLTPTTPYSATCNTIAGCAVYQRAGRTFPLQVQAMQWTSDSETDEAFCDNALTPNFRTTDATTAYTLTSTMVESSKISNGALGVSALAISSGGQTTIANQTLSEVGRFRIGVANTSSYLGTNVAAMNANAASRSAVFGRFVPDAFVVTLDDTTTYQAACSSQFTYAGVTDGGVTTGKAGQPIPLNLTVRAVNALSPAGTTLNYSGAVVDTASTPVSYARLHGAVLPVTPTPAGTGVFKVATTDTYNFVNGVSSNSLSTLQYIYNLANAPASNAPVNIAANLTATDADSTTGTDSTVARAFRLGRLVLENAYGPEQLALPIPLRAEYFDGTRWQKNTLDSCSSYQKDRVSLVELVGGLDDAVTSITRPTTVTNVVAGSAALTSSLLLAAPSNGSNGSIDLQYRVTDLPSWLQFDWDNDGQQDDAPRARATFGRYRGSDRVIYWREQLPVVP